MSAKSESPMDEVQFNASLDALLAGENLNEDGSPTYSNNFPTLPAPAQLAPKNSSNGSQPMQGLLTSSGQPAIAPAMNHLQPASGGGLAPVSHVYGSTPAPSTYPNHSYLSYNMSGSQAPTTDHSITSCGDTVSITSSRSGGKRRGSSASTNRKRVRDASAVSEDEGDKGRRRQDRNAREQQRSQKITQQIEHLRDVLVAANVQFKPDKYSTLVSVADYITKLQERSAMLDVEHKKLVDTISQTNEAVNQQYMPASTNGSDPPGSASLMGAGNDAKGQKEDLFVQSIDYRTIFAKSGVPLAVLSIDGRFLECNEGFERLTGYDRDELLPAEKMEANEVHSSANAALVPTASSGDLKLVDARNMSLFNLLGREHMEQVFMAMSEMLKQSPDKIVAETDPTKIKDSWSGYVALARNLELKVR